MMKSPTNNFNKKNIFALAVTILLLLGKVNTTEKEIDTTEEEEMQAEGTERIVGAAKHSLNTKDHEVTLVVGSRPAAANNKEDYEQYKDLFPEACDVELGKKVEEGYIVLSYSKKSKAALEGCTVDFYTDLRNTIEFSAFLTNVGEGGVEGCVQGGDDHYNDNVLPFAYSHPPELEELQKVPKIGNSGKGCNAAICLNKKCIEKTGLELRWTRTKDEANIENINLLINPIGSPSYRETSEEMSKFNDENSPEFPKVEIKATGERYKVRFEGSNVKEPKNEDKKYNCTANPARDIIDPMAWEIVGTEPDQKKYLYLLAFHLLPQKASRQIKWSKRSKRAKVGNSVSFSRIQEEKTPESSSTPEVLPDALKGPECNDLRILFSTNNYALLTVDPPTTTTSTSSSTTTTTTPTTTATTTTTKKPSGFPWLIIIVIVVVLLVLSSIGGIVAFFVLRGSDKDEETKSKMDKGTKSKRDKGTKSKNDNTKSLTSKNDKSINSAAGTSSKVKDAEEGKKKGTDTAIENTKSLEI
ncbi:hypothetical protein ACQ4LE_006365 [Meloidogyne hapla]|uniref:Ig-like domain-containing protein n=1 Tax=Meloidogyne hapla TaxID=6305 RepID=A0A1I8BM94_MELHA